MVFFNNSYLPLYEDDEILSAIKRARTAKAKDYNGGFADGYFANRLSMPTYLNNLKYIAKPNVIKTKQEAVYKRISQGVGKNALSNLLQYMARESQEQKRNNASPVQLYDELGKELNFEDIQRIKTEWSEDFISNQLREANPDKLETLSIVNTRIQKLSNLENAGKITQNESDELTDYRISGVTKNIWEVGTKVEINPEISGIITSIDDNGLMNLSTSDHDVVELETCDVTPLMTKEGWAISHCNDKNSHKLALDDENYNVETPSVEQMRRELPLDFEHIVLSVGGDNPDPEKARAATQEHLKYNLYQRGFRYLMAEHNDDGHLHYHVVVHRKNTISRKYKFPTSQHDTFIFRKEFGETLDKYGIDNTVTFRKDRGKALEISQNKAEKAKTQARRFASEKKNPDAPNLFALRYTVNTYIDEKIVSKLDEFGFSKKEKKEIQEIVNQCKVSIKLNDEESFTNAVTGYSKALEKISEQTASFWADTMSSGNVRDFAKQRMPEKNKENAIKAQASLTERHLKSYEGLSLVEEELKEDLKKGEKYDPESKEKITKRLQSIEELKYRTESHILRSEKYVKDFLDKEAKFTHVNDIRARFDHLDSNIKISKNQSISKSLF